MYFIYIFLIPTHGSLPSLQFSTFIIQAYFIYRSLMFDDHDDHLYYRRGPDYIPGGIQAFGDLIAVLLFCWLCGDTHYRAYNGMEILRRKSLLRRDSDLELFFMISMYHSFDSAKSMSVTGGDYIIMDKTFVISLTAVFCTYVVFIFQFIWRFDYTGDEDDPVHSRSEIGYYIHGLEPHQPHKEICSCWFNPEFEIPPAAAIPGWPSGSNATEYCFFQLKKLNMTRLKNY